LTWFALRAGFLAAVFASPVLGAQPPATLSGRPAALWLGGRPPECSAGASPGGNRPLFRTSPDNVWERAKSPDLRRYCDLVAGAASKLAGATAMAQVALDMAHQADALLPGHAAPLVLAGRALAALGQPDAALAAFREGKLRDAGALDDPPAGLAWARTLARSGTALPGEAAEAYRALLPRTGSLATGDRAAAEMEAGLVSLADGPPALDDATAALRDAVKDSQDELQGVAVLALVLALDRGGLANEARALLADRAVGDPRSVLGTPRAREVAGFAPGEATAMLALALEPIDVAAAWSAHARLHLTDLSRGSRGRGLSSPASSPAAGARGALRTSP
jgi:hypothetical protein